MFTGLVREIGRLSGISRRGGVTRLDIEAPLCAPRLALGDSLAVNGICLTVTAARRASVSVEAVDETRRVTTLDGWRGGDRVHLEPALRAGDPLGGHLVLGHVDGVGRILSRRRKGGSLILEISTPPRITEWLPPKGSIAVDGVSLTLDGAPKPDRFTLSLIPHTLDATLFGHKRIGDALNLEADILAKGAQRRQPTAEDPVVEAESGDQGGLSVRDILDKGFRRNR